MDYQRLFVGNLPNNITESELKNLFKKYNVSKIDIKRKQAFDQESVFAFVNISSKQVNNCLSELSTKKWKNCNLKVQVAKENFLDRLKKEHQEKNKKNDPNATFTKNFELKQNMNGAKNKRIVFNDDLESSQPQTEFSSPKRIQTNPSEETLLKNIPCKRNLPMFCGTTSVSYTVPKPKKQSPQSSQVNVKQLANKASSAMEKFEAFSDVWKDCDEDYEPNFNIKRNLNDVRENHSPKWKSKFSNDDGYRSEDRFSRNKFPNDSNSKQTWKMISSTSDEVYDNSIDFEIVPQTNNSKSKKLSWKSKPLENDDAQQNQIPPEPEIPNTNAKQDNEKTKEIKSSWKIKVVEDERFKLNDKFHEDDSYVAEKPTRKNSVPCLFEQDIPNDSAAKDVFQYRQLVRYDPSRPDHKILEKKNQTVFKNNKTIADKTSLPQKKKTKTKKKPDKKDLKEQIEIPKPVVSKEKHYSVADALKNAFKKTEDHSEFRLSALFDEKLKDVCITEPKYQKAVLIKSVTESKLANDLESEEEQLEDELPVDIMPAAASEKVLGKCGVWGETFFFKADDSRFQEAMEFYKSEDDKKVIDFGKQRIQLRSIVRKKLQNTRRDNKLFKQKLGGRINKSKFKMRLKNARSY